MVFRSAMASAQSLPAGSESAETLEVCWFAKTCCAPNCLFRAFQRVWQSGKDTFLATQGPIIIKLKTTEYFANPSRNLAKWQSPPLLWFVFLELHAIGDKRGKAVERAFGGPRQTAEEHNPENRIVERPRVMAEDAAEDAA